jgi:hypothetical protein
MPSSQSTCNLVPLVTAYSIELPGDLLSAVEIARVGELADGTFTLHADVWAVRCMGRCLNRDGRWEHEPLPSSRTDAFKARTRFSCDEAKLAAQDAVVAENYPGGRSFKWAT